MNLAVLEKASSGYPKPSGFKPSYGTAGFRADAAVLESTVFRCGLLIGLRARSTGQACGVMITASHNPENDNGVKLVEPTGEMLQAEWEIYATQLAQADTDHEVAALVANLAASHPCAAAAGHVIVGRDTRDSGETLTAACAAGVQAVGVEVLDIGIVTTPELHFSVQTYNQYHALEEQAYFTNLLEAFRTLTAGTAPLQGPLHVDCANGVGAQKLQLMATEVAKLGLQLQLYNAGEGRLNHMCGADYVQKEQTYPAGMSDISVSAVCASIDGDADRVVFFTKGSDGSFALLDGDKIAALAAVFIQQLLNNAPPGTAAGIRTGIVQTAYANGASSSFITQQLGLQVCCTNTGVKYLHHEAKNFDIGIYFESNGHGTVLFKPSVLQHLQDMDENMSVMQLLAVSRLMNQAVGDALSGLLLCVAVLRSGVSLEQWQQLYKDLPSRQLKLVVKDRTVITTTDAERRCTNPAGLQAAIDSAVAKYQRGRAFARPSGTEDAVRVYAEAANQTDADLLAREVAGIVYDMAGGVGTRP